MSMESEKRDSEDREEYCPQLSEDLVFEEILPRLPLESLIRLKLVSKRWLRYITTDSSFARNHLRRQSQTAEISAIVPYGSREMYIFDHRSKTFRSRDLLSCTNRFFSRFSKLGVVGTCNGLVCIALEDDNWGPSRGLSNREVLVLWNPETGEARDILVPPVPYHLEPCYGFGYDELHDDYKVVRVLYLRSTFEYEHDSEHESPPTECRTELHVYTGNSGRWRKLEKDLLGFSCFQTSGGAVLLDGCLYLLLIGSVESTNAASRLCILSFDLRYEEFRVIDIPNRTFVFDPSLCQGLLAKWKRNGLAYLSFPEDLHDVIFLLVLDGDGNVVSDGLRRFDWSTGVERNWCLCVVSHGQFIVDEGDPSKIIMYDLVGCANENIARRDLDLPMTGWDPHRPSYFTVNDYVPSFVSVYPKQYTDMCR